MNKMHIFRILILIVLFILSGSVLLAQTKKSKPVDKVTDSDRDPNFGKYYKIAEYSIRVPFNDQPNISPIAENKICKVTSYQYAYPKPSDDINILYGIDVCEFKTDTAFKNPKSRIDYLAGNTKMMYESAAKGSLLKQTTGGTDASYFVCQRMQIHSNELGEIFLTSLYFYSRGNVIRLFVFTPNNLDNKRIEDYFASVKFD